MNKTLKITVLIAILSLSIGVIAVKAEDGSDDSNESSSESLKDRMEANRDLRREKMDELKDSQKRLLEEKKMTIKDLKASSTLPKKEMNMIRRDIKASTTVMFKKLHDEKKEVARKMKLRTFDIRKDALVKQLTMALSNLTNIAARLGERITKAEESGRNMTEAKAALVIAHDKLAKAKIAVEALAAFKYTPSTPNASSTPDTTEVELEKPRKIGDEAIKAVKEARDALKKVVGAIAKNMGFGKFKNATTTPTTPGTTTPPTTSTTTATTTSN